MRENLPKMKNYEETSFGPNLTRELRESRSSKEKLPMVETGHHRKDNATTPEGPPRKQNFVKDEEQEQAVQSEQLLSGGGAGGGAGGGGWSEQPAAGERPTLQLEAIHLVLHLCWQTFFTRFHPYV